MYSGRNTKQKISTVIFLKVFMPSPVVVVMLFGDKAVVDGWKEGGREYLSKSPVLNTSQQHKYLVQFAEKDSDPERICMC